MPKSIGMVEFNSVARGIYTSDQMVKAANVDIVTATTICPGKYITIVHGNVAEVEAALRTGEEEAGEFLVDSTMISNVHPDIFPAIVSATMPEHVEALGILEAYSLSSMVVAADKVLKTAELAAIELRLGTGLGGKAFFTFTGSVAAVENGIRVGRETIGTERGLLINAEVIPSPAPEILQNLF